MTKKPYFRKLRGYAFDPSLSLKIDTALINEITYKVKWEEGTEGDTSANERVTVSEGIIPNGNSAPGGKSTAPGKKSIIPGPVGEYLEVIDYDPTVGKFYAPVDLDDHYILAQDGLDPSASNPQFHQQMVYAVAMTTIQNFETGLGRRIFWSPRITVPQKDENQQSKKEKILTTASAKKIQTEYVHRLRIYPHALREANAYYSPQKKALLFGYFAARPAEATLQMPDNLTFTCLSHDIIAHETTHAILDGLHRKYIDDTNPDVLAFHEAFADIVALFQHFTFPDVLKNQIAATRGNLASQNQLGKLAQEFGIAIGNYGALRDAIGGFNENTKQWEPREPTGNEYRTVMEPHERGSILVSAVFEAFLSIYKKRVADLLRIASNGTGVLNDGELHPDLVNRLADEAAKASRHVLNMCIRALDYCPPLDINFGDFLRGIITADMDIVSDDKLDYRLAFIDAFRRRGIYPVGIKHLSIESLGYPIPDSSGLDELVGILVDFLKQYNNEITYAKTREDIYDINIKYLSGSYTADESVTGLHQRISKKFDGSLAFEKITGLMFSDGWSALSIPTSRAYFKEGGPSFFIQSLHVASRVGPNGEKSNQVIMTIIQRTALRIDKDAAGELKINHDGNKDFDLFGGCTLIFDLHTQQLKYAISKPLIQFEESKENVTRKINEARCFAVYKYQNGIPGEQTQYQAYFGLAKGKSFNEPFNFLHTHL